MRDFAIPTDGSQPFGSTVGPDGNIWFTEQAANKIGVLNVSAAPPNDAPLAVPLSLAFTSPANSQPASQPLSIADSVTRSPFSITESSFGPWLFISPSGDLVSTQTIDVSASPKRLPCGTGTFAGAISLAAGPLRQTVTVQYRVLSPTSAAGC